MVFGWFKRFTKKSDSLDSLDSLTQMTHSNELTHSTHSLDKREDINLQKDALELGLAAGYAGRSLKSIENTLERLESIVISKDWANQEIIPLIKSIDANEQRRFTSLVSIINSIGKVAEKSPSGLRKELLNISEQLEEHGNLTKRMVRLINVVKEVGEINYTDLANKMDMTEDGLRSLVSLVCRKTNELQRFRRGDKTWVKYASNTAELSELTHSLDSESDNYRNFERS
jgi:iron-sulfur cluster repair protein YtfE (RIC family)